MTTPRTPLLSAVVGELAQADEDLKRELAGQLRPYLADPARLLDAGEKAEQLGLHPDTLARMARAGRIWAKKVGREWRFRADRSDIQPLASESPMPPTRASPRRAPAVARSSLEAIRGPR